MTIKLWPHALFVNWYTVKISFRVLYPTHAPNAVGVWRKAWKKWLMPKWKTAIIWTDWWSQQCYVSHIWKQLECTYSVHANMHSVKIGNACTENLVKKDSDGALLVALLNCAVSQKPHPKRQTQSEHSHISWWGQHDFKDTLSHTYTTDFI